MSHNKENIYKAQIPPSYEIEITDGQLVGLDIVPIVEGHHYHLLHQGRSYEVLVDGIDRKASIYHLRINGYRYAVDIKDSWDALVVRLGLDSVPEARMSELQSPMPGQVKKVLVKPGDEVQEGDLLLNMEAMKMENQLKAAHEAIVKTVNVAEGDVVQKGQVLVEFE